MTPQPPRKQPKLFYATAKQLAAQNVVFHVDDQEILHIRVDLKRELGLTKSGLNYLVASSHVHQPRKAMPPGRNEVINLTIFRPIHERGPDTDQLLKELLTLLTPEQQEIVALWLDELDGYRRPLIDYLENIKKEPPAATTENFCNLWERND